MADSIFSPPRITDDIHVRVFAPCRVDYYGTWQQLKDEGLIEDGEPMPSRCFLSWGRGHLSFDLTRKWLPGTRAACRLDESDWWRLIVIDTRYELEGSTSRLLRLKEIQNDADRAEVRRLALRSKFLWARSDEKFTTWMDQTLRALRNR